METEIKYEGYIQKQKESAERMQRTASQSLEDINIESITGLRLEAKEKLLKIRPATIGQAMNISGVSPADISVLILECARQKRKNG